LTPEDVEATTVKQKRQLQINKPAQQVTPLKTVIKFKKLNLQTPTPTPTIS
jgi:hypothetical protein